MAAAAADTGIPIAILRSAKRAGCPAFDQANRVHLRLLLPWLFSSDAAASVDWHQRWKRAQALGAELEVSKQRGDLIDAQHLASQLVAAATVCRSLIFRDLQDAPMQLAAAGDDVPKNREVLSAILWAHFAAFRDSVSPFLAAVDQHTDGAESEILNPKTDEKAEEQNHPDQVG